VETTNSPFTSQLTKGEVLQLPIGHMEGNYFSAPPDELRRMESEDRVAFPFMPTPEGEITGEANPMGRCATLRAS